MTQGFQLKQTPVKEFDHGNDEKRRIRKDDAQQENVARFAMQTSVADDGDGDGNIQWDSDETTNEFQSDQDGISDFDRIVNSAVFVEKNVETAAVVHLVSCFKFNRITNIAEII